MNGILCRVYNDGSHYVAHKLENAAERLERREKTDNGEFDKLYFGCLKNGKSSSEASDEIYAYYGGLMSREEIAEGIERIRRNIWLRVKRFKRKAYMQLNKWNYFVTVTYDDKKQTEESFRMRLSKCLSNLHTRRGWLYMGVFERAPETGRLHFHAIMHVPAGQLVGSVELTTEYNPLHKKKESYYKSSFFTERFGRSEMKPINGTTLKFTSALDYIVKYINKSNESIRYSRGTPESLIKEISEDDFAAEFMDFVVKYVLFDDVICDPTEIVNDTEDYGLPES